MNVKEVSPGVLFLITKKITLNSIIEYAEFVEQVYGTIPLEIMLEIKRDLEKFHEVYGHKSIFYIAAFRLNKAA